MSGAQLQNGDPGEASTLNISGALTLNSSASVFSFVKQQGTTAGTDYSQVSATGTVDLASAHFTLHGQDQNGNCLTLHVGDVLTPITTSGSRSGTFSGIPDGTIVPVDCLGGAGTAPTVRINYTANSVTATVVTSGSSGTATTTTLSASPSSPVTNQTVTLTATVSPAASGAVEFDNHGTPISGCTNRPVSSGVASCQTTFTPGTESLTATFTSSDSSFQGSSSSPLSMTVGEDGTSTALSVSNATPTVGQSVTYTATVTPNHAGATHPAGSVQFLDGGSVIGSCASRPLGAGGSASCTVSYPSAGSHAITASYGGDGNFAGSSSGAKAVTVVPSLSTIKAALSKVLSPKGKGAKIGALLKSGGFTFTFPVPSGGTLTITWYFVPKGAHVTKAKPVKVAGVTASFSKAGSAKVKVRMTAKGRQMLKAARSLKITTKASFKPTGTSAVSLKKTFKLKR